MLSFELIMASLCDMLFYKHEARFIVMSDTYKKNKYQFFFYNRSPIIIKKGSAIKIEMEFINRIYKWKLYYNSLHVGWILHIIWHF